MAFILESLAFGGSRKTDKDQELVGSFLILNNLGIDLCGSMMSQINPNVIVLL